jgi:hypothetical protein
MAALTTSGSRRSPAWIGCAIVTFLACGGSPPPSHQQHIHAMGAQVMPFDLDKTTHVFEMTEDGGIQQVLAKDYADAEQIRRIRQHLEHEAERFRAGDFSDPARLHGADMPGLRELSAGAADLSVKYATLPDGAELVFSSQDIRLITAVHRWFGAQLSEHGADATTR